MLIMKRLSELNKVDSDDIYSLNTCTTCGICTENCPAGIKPPELIVDARRALVASGKVTKKQADINNKLKMSGNVFGDIAPRLGWLADRNDFRDKSDTVFFTGCLASYRYPEVASKTFDVLKRFGATVLPDEKCCGSPLLRTGNDASEFIDSNLKQIEDIGAKTVITGCAGCYTTLKNDYHGELEILSIPEFLAEKVSQLNLEPLNLIVAYHDPCHLGRRHKIYEEPRKVIEAICDLEEMKANRNRSRCCGGGGGVRAGYGELSLRLARKRLEDVPDGVDYIVTSCPLCVRNLNDAGGDGKVIDLVELVSKAIKD